MNAFSLRVRWYEAVLAAGVIVASTASLAPAAVHEIVQVQATWVPDSITAQPGDTIRWTFTQGGHTVTSGTDCEPDGLFDADLDKDNPLVEYEIPAGANEDIPFFCIPHCDEGMSGVVVVDSCAADFDGSGAVDFADLLAILSSWGPCEDCPEDLGGGGEVSFGDLLLLLSAWGPCP